jgi:hypothetical protein
MKTFYQFLTEESREEIRKWLDGIAQDSIIHPFYFYFNSYRSFFDNTDDSELDFENLFNMLISYVINKQQFMMKVDGTINVPLVIEQPEDEEYYEDHIDHVGFKINCISEMPITIYNSHLLPEGPMIYCGLSQYYTHKFLKKITPEMYDTLLKDITSKPGLHYSIRQRPYLVKSKDGLYIHIYLNRNYINKRFFDIDNCDVVKHIKTQDFYDFAKIAQGAFSDYNVKNNIKNFLEDSWPKKPKSLIPFLQALVEHDDLDEMLTREVCQKFKELNKDVSFEIEQKLLTDILYSLYEDTSGSI